MENSDMRQCHRFLHSWQDTEPVICADFLRMKFLDVTSSNQTVWDSKLVSYIPKVTQHMIHLHQTQGSY